MRDLISVLLCTPHRRNDGFTLEQDLELITLLTNTSNKEKIQVTGRPGEQVAKNRLDTLRCVVPTLDKGGVVAELFLYTHSTREGIRERVQDLHDAPPSKRGCNSHRDAFAAGVRVLQAATTPAKQSFQRDYAARAARAVVGQKHVPQPELVCNPELPPRALDYDHDTEICMPSPGEQRAPLPLGAMVSFAPRKDCDVWRPLASIPSTWPLVLQPSCFHAAIKVDRAYILADVTRDTLIDDIESDIRKFLRHGKALRLVRISGDTVHVLASKPQCTARQADLFNVAHELAIVPIGELQVIRPTIHRPSHPRTFTDLHTCPSQVPSVLSHGCLMLYKDTQTDTVVSVTVDSVHYDDIEPYYTIVLPCGSSRATVRARLWHGNQASNEATQPHQMPLPLDPLQRARWFARQGAGNSRPGNAQHNSMINNLSAEDHTHKEETFLPTAPADWKQVAEHLDAIELQADAICYNCATLVWKRNATIKVPATDRENLRAWRVYSKMIEAYAESHNVEVNEVLKCEPCAASADGTPLCRVFSCGSCRAEKTRDPSQYDLMDGVQANGDVQDTGLGDTLPMVLACLSSDERLTLSIVKVIDGAYEDYSKRNGSTSYSRYGGGAFHGPADLSKLSEAYRGMSSLLVRDTPDAPRSEARVKAALEYLMDSSTGNPLLRHTLTCYEREMRADPTDTFPQEAGGGALPIMQWESFGRREPTAAEHVCDDDSDDEGPTERPLPPHRRPRDGNLPRTLHGNYRLEALVTVHDTGSDAVLDRNAIDRLVVGDKRTRDGEVQPQLARTQEPSTSVEDALNTVLNSKGINGWYSKVDKTSCTPQHHAKARLAGVNDRFRRASEYLWFRYQDAMKRALHGRTVRTTSADLAATATVGDLRAQQRSIDEAARAALPCADNLTREETFTGGVSKSIVGGKSYWRAAFVQLMAMCVE